MQIVLATRNKGKIREIKGLMKGVQLLSLDKFDVPPIQETGSTFEENASIKAVETSLKTGLPALADDSGLEVDALAGAPGVRSARWAVDDEANNRKLLESLEGLPDERRTARYRCVCALARGDNVVFVTQGVCEGRIGHKARGRGGFGYDPYFLLPPGFKKTMAEIPLAQKNRISHRAQAIREVMRRLRHWIRGETRVR